MHMCSRRLEVPCQQLRTWTKSSPRMLLIHYVEWWHHVIHWHVDEIRPANDAHTLMQIGVATSTIEHVGEIFLANAHAFAQNGGATSSIAHVGEIKPANGAHALAQIGDSMSAIVHVGEILRMNVDHAFAHTGNATSSIAHVGECCSCIRAESQHHVINCVRGEILHMNVDHAFAHNGDTTSSIPHVSEIFHANVALAFA